MQHNHTNDTYQESHVPDGFQVKTDLPMVLLASVIVIANGTILALFVKKRSLKTVTNYFLASLAISDLMTGLITIPLFLSCNATQRNAICEASVPFYVFTSLSTIAHIASITADRYIAILVALRYHALVTKKRARLVISTIWISAVILSLVQLIWARPGEIDVNEDRLQDFMRKDLAYTIVIIVVTLIPFPLMIFAYARIFVAILRQNKLTRDQHRAGGGEQSSTHELRAICMFVIMLVAFSFCLFPNDLIRLQNNIPDMPMDFIVSEKAMHVLVYLHFTTSFLNPCFYGFGKRDFCSALVAIVRFYRADAQETSLMMRGTTRSSVM